MRIVLRSPSRPLFEVYDSILEAGAPGVSTNFGVMADQSCTGEDACNEEGTCLYLPCTFGSKWCYG